MSQANVPPADTTFSPNTFLKALPYVVGVSGALKLLKATVLWVMGALANGMGSMATMLGNSHRELFGEFFGKFTDNVALISAAMLALSVLSWAAGIIQLSSTVSLANRTSYRRSLAGVVILAVPMSQDIVSFVFVLCGFIGLYLLRTPSVRASFTR